jgi:hypothetical protein
VPIDRRSKVLLAALLAVGLVVGGVSLVSGFSLWPADEAFALPFLPPTGTLGIGQKTVAPCDGPFTVESKFSLDRPADMTAPLVTRVERKAIPIPKPEPVPEPKSTVTAARTSTPAPSRSAASTTGWNSAKVSWYGPGFYGNNTASGMVLTESSMIVAHRTLAFGTKIQFEYNGHTCTATVQDRGPHISGREFDLGPGTAKALGFSGVGTVRYRIVG